IPIVDPEQHDIGMKMTEAVDESVCLVVWSQVTDFTRVDIDRVDVEVLVSVGVLTVEKSAFAVGPAILPDPAKRVCGNRSGSFEIVYRSHPHIEDAILRCQPAELGPVGADLHQCPLRIPENEVSGNQFKVVQGASFR